MKTNAYPNPVKLEELIPADMEKFRNKEKFENREAWRAAMQREIDVTNDGWQRLQEIDELAKKSGSILYRAIIIPRGDGAAAYQVVKVNKRTCVVKHLDLGDDAWHDPKFGEGGSFPIAVVKHFL